VSLSKVPKQQLNHLSFSDRFEYNLNEAVYRGRGYLGAKSKGYDATIKRGVKEHLLGTSDISGRKSSCHDCKKLIKKYCAQLFVSISIS